MSAMCVCVCVCVCIYVYKWSVCVCWSALHAIHTYTFFMCVCVFLSFPLWYTHEQIMVMCSCITVLVIYIKWPHWEPESAGVDFWMTDKRINVIVAENSRLCLKIWHVSFFIMQQWRRSFPQWRCSAEQQHTTKVISWHFRDPKFFSMIKHLMRKLY